MYIPSIKNVIYRNDVFMERVLASDGTFFVKVGDVVEAFTELGVSKVSYESLDLGESIKFTKGKGIGSRIISGATLGKIGSRNVKAPFTGTLVKVGEKYILEQEKKDYLLLSGLWGEVVDITEGKSVLIKTQATDLHMMACTKGVVEGELLVFPNPSDILQVQYLEKYAKNVFRKILYVGDFANLALVKKAVGLHVGGILAGSALRESFVLAKKSGVFLGVFSGFGNLPTPQNVFDTLNSVSNRFIFVRGESRIVRIPMPNAFDSAQLKKSQRHARFLRKVKKGMAVLVVDDIHFGWVGRVEKVLESSIVVKLDENEESVELAASNVLALV